jgi:hypothetical protein
VTAGVVNGSFFQVMGLRPLHGRLLNSADDGPQAAGVAVLTHRFWTAIADSDPAVVGKTIRLGARTATVVGVLEPSVPYPAETQIIANLVTSPHHLGATMVTDRTHRMTELFGRLAPGATVEAARAELTGAHASMMREHPEAYSARAQVRLQVTTLPEQIASPARTILLLLLAAAAVVFVIACSNVANLILGRSVRRQAELALRAALGASRGALRRTLLAESLVLCAAGAVLGLMLAAPLLTVVARYAARFSVRAQEATVDSSVLGLGAGLALVASVLLAYVPRLPSSDRPGGLGLAGGSLRMTPGTNRRLRVFATTQIACSFVLLAGAGMLVATLNALQTAHTAYDMRQVLAIDVPEPATAAGTAGALDFFQEAARRIGELPGVQRCRGREDRALARPQRRLEVPLCIRGLPPRGMAKKTRPAGSGPSRLGSSQCSASRSSRAETSPTRTARTPSSSPWSAKAWPGACSEAPTPSTGVCGLPTTQRLCPAVSSASWRTWTTRTSFRNRR